MGKRPIWYVLSKEQDRAFDEIQELRAAIIDYMLKPDSHTALMHLNKMLEKYYDPSYDKENKGDSNE